VPTLDNIPVTQLRGVGSHSGDKLARLGIHTVQDILFHLPSRYLDRTRITPIGALTPNTSVVIEGQIRGCDIVFGRRRSLMCKVQDNTGTATLRFFHFTAAQRANLAVGTRLRCFGDVRLGSAGLELYHPEYERLDQHRPAPLAAHLTPVYPTLEGVTQQRLRALTTQALRLLTADNLPELSASVGGAHGGKDAGQISLAEALTLLHRPPIDTPIDQLATGQHPAQQRLAFEELLAHHLSLLLLRHSVQTQPAPRLPKCGVLLERFLANLPFAPTGAQRRVAAEIAGDLTQPVPMLRLLQGDVGSGKTLVAAVAALQAIGGGYQAAIMVPTEIVAEQHRTNFESWLAPLGIGIALLTGKLTGKARDAQLTAIANGKAQLVIGTHALFQEGVAFHNLGLSIIDEQHRFGVHQRLALREKSTARHMPHQLIMTATPIPRTLAMSAYADLDCSVIDELPPGRSPVTTVLIGDERRAQVVARVRAACGEGRQAYWVCTLIEESEILSAQAASATADELRLALPELRIGLVHGRLKPREKVAVMSAFKSGELQLLVATTVIEVGVDVANASLMVIDNPERLGLAQLHQLRGRVGRGSAESHCVLLYSSPLSRHASERLRVMRETNDGFVIAEKDLQLRGPGEFLGTRQTGEMQLRIADLLRDGQLLPDVKIAAESLLREQPQIATAIVRRWLRGVARYAQV